MESTLPLRSGSSGRHLFLHAAKMSVQSVGTKCVLKRVENPSPRNATMVYSPFTAISGAPLLSALLGACPIIDERRSSARVRDLKASLGLSSPRIALLFDDNIADHVLTIRVAMDHDAVVVFSSHIDRRHRDNGQVYRRREERSGRTRREEICSPKCLIF